MLRKQELWGYLRRNKVRFLEMMCLCSVRNNLLECTDKVLTSNRVKHFYCFQYIKE